MKSRGSIFIPALVIQTSIPLIAGIVLFWAYIAIGSFETTPNNSPQVKALVAKQGTIRRATMTIGMAALIALFAFVGQILPSLATALLLALLALWLVPVSKAFYVISSVMIGTSVAAIWFHHIFPSLPNMSGPLTAFAAVGFIFSSLLVCRIPR